MLSQFRPARPRRSTAAHVAATLLALMPLAAAAQDQPWRTELVLGNSTALTGPSAQLGRELNAGLSAAFNEANTQGTLGTRRIRFVELDDGYEPSRTSPNMRKLAENPELLAVVGNVGTPTAVVAAPVAQDAGLPFVGAFTGAGVLRKSPPERWIVNFRASYAEETGAMVDALIDHAGLDPSEVAFFTQRDAYGDAGFNGGVAALKRRGLKSEASIAHGRYERNTTAVENALADVLAAPVAPKAVIMVGAYAPCARFVTLAAENGLHARFLNVSFVGTGAFIDAAGPAAEGVIITQVVPHPASDLPAAREFRDAIKSASAGPRLVDSFTAFEGYLVGRMTVAAIKQAGPSPTREGVLEALLNLGEFDLGLGATLKLSETEHQACHAVWPTIVRSGKAVPMNWAELRENTHAEVK